MREEVVSPGLATRAVEPVRRHTRERIRRQSRQFILRSSAAKTVSGFFANRLPWRARSMSLALIVGLLCGVVACLYELITAFVLHVVWQQGLLPAQHGDTCHQPRMEQLG